MVHKVVMHGMAVTAIRMDVVGLSVASVRSMDYDSHGSKRSHRVVSIRQTMSFMSDDVIIGWNIDVTDIDHVIPLVLLFLNSLLLLK